VGFRPRDNEDWVKCRKCGTNAELDSEDVLETNRSYVCPKCGNRFQNVPDKTGTC
jgi:DNA-directed RNA polymerase subunit RPC12/RpoP